jgi:hypothetical protein
MADVADVADATKTQTGQQKPAAVAADTNTVTISLPSEVHEFFSKKAAADERSLAKYLSRELRQLYDDARNNGQGAQQTQHSAQHNAQQHPTIHV